MFKNTTGCNYFSSVVYNYCTCTKSTYYILIFHMKNTWFALSDKLSNYWYQTRTSVHKIMPPAIGSMC